MGLELMVPAAPSCRIPCPRPVSQYLPGAFDGTPRGLGTRSGGRAWCLSSATLSLSLCFLDFFLDLPCDELLWGLLGWAQSVSRGRLRCVVGAEEATSPRSQSRPLWLRSLLASARGSWALWGSSLVGRWMSVPAGGPGVGSRASRLWGRPSFPLTVGWALWVKCDILGFLLARGSMKSGGCGRFYEGRETVLEEAWSRAAGIPWGASGRHQASPELSEIQRPQAPGKSAAPGLRKARGPRSKETQQPPASSTLATWGRLDTSRASAHPKDMC